MKKEIHFFEIPSGWKIALSRYLPEKIKGRHPVLLIHGLTTNHLTFDLSPQHSTARFLCKLGWDTWVIDLRGRGLSEKLPGAKAKSCSMDEYLSEELVLAQKFVAKKTEIAQSHWVGHSMGGILLLCRLAREATPSASGIKSGISVAASLNYGLSNSRFKKALGMKWLLRLTPSLSVAPISSILAPLARRSDNAVERFYYWPSNIEPETARALMADGFHGVPTGVLAQLISAFEPGGLREAQSGVSYMDGVPKIQVPVFLIAGDKDFQCPPDAVELVYDELKEKDKKLMIFGKALGNADHYGHFDLLLGKNAETEVLPHIAEWLRAHD